MEAYQRLEFEFGKWAKVENVVACSSGTAALHLALESLQLPLGSLVIVPEFTMVACARAVTLAGLTPVFVDCTSNLLINLDLVDQVLAEDQAYRKYVSRKESGYSRTAGRDESLWVSAIMPVHVYGRQCDMEGIADLATKYDLKVIEDLAEAHGVSPHPKTDAAAWSFYKNKIVAGEEGGAVAFRKDKAAETARQLRSLGFTKKHDFNHIPRGHNYRMANCLANPILVNFEKHYGEEGKLIVDRLIEDRWRIVALYDEYCPDEWRMPKRQAPWVYDLRIPALLKPELQDAVVGALISEGVQARHSFKPMSQQPEYTTDSKSRVTEVRLPWRAFRASMEVIYLPIQPWVTNEDIVKKSFEVIRRALRT